MEGWTHTLGLTHTHISTLAGVDNFLRMWPTPLWTSGSERGEWVVCVCVCVVCVVCVCVWCVFGVCVVRVCGVCVCVWCVRVWCVCSCACLCGTGRDRPLWHLLLGNHAWRTSLVWQEAKQIHQLPLKYIITTRPLAGTLNAHTIPYNCIN